MAQALNETGKICPLCGEGLDYNLPSWKMSGVRADLRLLKDSWPEISAEFRRTGSLESTAARFAIDGELARRALNFISTELCGCRSVTCVSCFDDYRNEL